MEKESTPLFEPSLRGGVKPFDLSTLPKCGAKPRSGKPCQRYGNKKNGRCRLHGGRSTGAKNQKGTRNSSFKTGYYTQEAVQQRREVAELIRECRELCSSL